MNPASQPASPVKPSTDASAESTTPLHGNRDYIWMVLLLATGATLRFLHLGVKSFWFDEGVSVAIARLGWYNFLRILSRHEANMTLYYLALRPWLLLGHSETFVRALSVLFGVAAIPALYCLGKEVYGRQTAFIAAALLTFSAFHVRYSQEARSYSLFMLLSILSSYFFWRSWKSSSQQSFRWHLITSVLAVYAHFFAALLLVVQWIWLRVRGTATPEWRQDWRWIAILSAPLFLFVVTTGAGPLAWIPHPGWTELSTFVVGLTGNGGWPLLLAYGVSLGLLIALMARRGRQSDSDRASTEFLVFWLVAPVLFVLLISQVRSFFLARYFIFVLPALLLLAAHGIQSLPSTWLRAAFLAIFLALSWRGVSAYYRQDFDITREDWRQASTYVLAHSQPSDVLVFHVLMGRMPYEFYRWNIAGPFVVAPRHGDTITYQDFLGRPDRNVLESLSDRYLRVWVVLSHNERGLSKGPDDTTEMIGQILGKDYDHVEVHHFTGVEVRLYEKTKQMTPEKEKAPSL